MPTAKQRAETKLLFKLQKAHGYALSYAKGFPRAQLMIDLKTKQMRTAYAVVLYVPAESALGVALKKDIDGKKHPRKKS